MEIYNFRRAPVVSVPIVEVAKTLAQQLRWMASSYVGHLDAKTTSLRSARLSTKSYNTSGMSTALPT
jgi:hypothetical protein